MRLFLTFLAALLTASATFADSLNCDLTAYSASDGLTATVDAGSTGSGVGRTGGGRVAGPLWY